MSLDGKLLHQIGGLTGFGWTASILGYLGTVLGYGSRFVTDPHSFLYAGVILFLATFGLDRLARSNDDQSDGGAAGDGSERPEADDPTAEAP